MKKLIILFVVCLTFLSCLTPKTLTKTTFTKEETVINLKHNKSDLYVLANTWMVDTFNSAESVIEFSDKESGVLLGKYLLQGQVGVSLYNNIDTRIFAKIDIRLKDNAAKIIIEPITDVVVYTSDAELQLNIKINSLITNFKSYMKTSEVDW